MPKSQRRLAKRMTNVQFITRLMEFSNHGALAQIFVLDALLQWSMRIAHAPLQELEGNPLISPQAWQSVAKEIEQKLIEHLGLHERKAPDSATPTQH